ncbi:MAG: hypothetical protein VYA89_03945, partial [Actinomycetota bacterium]|nr:hypothetical protein [Actinomycetota bacterium]
QAAAAVPDEYVDDGALVGSPTRIAERFEAWCSTPVTGLTVRPTTVEEIELIARLAGCKPRTDVVLPKGPAF